MKGNKKGSSALALQPATPTAVAHVQICAPLLAGLPVTPVAAAAAEQPQHASAIVLSLQPAAAAVALLPPTAPPAAGAQTTQSASGAALRMDAQLPQGTLILGGLSAARTQVTPIALPQQHCDLSSGSEDGSSDDEVGINVDS